MDIHKPKPAHTLREFASEIGVVVIGILIALGLEQTVEWLHWRTEVAEQTARVEEELSRILGTMRSRAEMEPCVDARLREIGEILDAHDGGAVPAIAGPVGRPLYFLAPVSAWAAANANQATSHMSAAAQARFAAAYGSYDVYLGVIRQEREAWQRLEVLAYAPQLTPQDWSDLRRAYLSARDLDGLVRNGLDGAGVGSWTATLRGVTPHPWGNVRAMPQVAALCRPLRRG